MENRIERTLSLQRHRSQKCMHDRPGRDRTGGCLKGESGSEPSSQCGMEKTDYLMRDHRRSERQDGDGGARLLKEVEEKTWMTFEKMNFLFTFLF